MLSVEGDRTAAGLKRRLGLLDATAIFVGVILGSGIFVAPSDVSAAVPGPLASIGLWLICGLIAACGAFCYAECGARLPRTGGFYVYYRLVHGEAVAFVGGWAALLITYPASIAAIALIFSEYLLELFPALPRGSAAFLAAGSVVAAGIVNAVGVRSGAWTQRVLTGTKVVALAVLCGAALFAAGESAPPASEAGPVDASGGAGAILAAVVVILWTYDGWSDVTLVAGEIRRPGRNIGRAVILGIGTLIVLYALVQLSVLVLIPAERAAASTRVVADAVSSGLGDLAGRLVALLVVVATLGAINGVVLTASRLGFAMARDGVFLRAFGAVHPRWGTPARSLFALVAATLFYVFAARFRELLTLFSFNVWIFYGLTAVALIVLRRRRVGEPVEWTAPGGWIPPAVVLATAAVLTGGLAWQEPALAARGLVLLLAGFPVYVAWRWLRPS